MESGWKLWVIILSEISGTAMLVGMGCMSLVSSDNIPKTHVDIAFAFGLIITAAIYIFAHLSGAFLNPWVALTSCILGHTKWDMAIIYTIAEFIGAALGYTLLWVVTPSKSFYRGAGICTAAPKLPLENYKVILSEFLATACLLFSCAGFWDKRSAGPHESVTVRLGLIIAGLVVAMGYFSGVSLNIARHMAPVYFHHTWNTVWLYLVGQGAASIFVGVIWRFVFVSPFAKETESEE